MISSGKCANCGANGSLKCAGCVNAPEYSPGEVTTTTFYCSKECQMDHWKTSHKSRCKVLQQRKRLSRTAHLLKQVYMIYKESYYPFDLRKVELKNGRLHLDGSAEFVGGKAELRPFPQHLKTDPLYKEAALSLHGCTTSLSLLGRLCCHILPTPERSSERGIGIEGLDIEIEKPKFLVAHVRVGEKDLTRHSVIYLETRLGNEHWVIDITGAQYGFQEALVPYFKYIREKGSVDKQKLTGDDFLKSEFSDLNYLYKGPLGKKVWDSLIPTIREMETLEYVARRHFVKFVDKHLETCEGLVDGTDAEAETRIKGFLLSLRLHMAEIQTHAS